jgi:prophage regulatory protein
METILRLQTVCDTLDVARTTPYALAKLGLLTPPIKISKRASGWPKSEVEAIISARIAGADDAEIKRLVAALVAARAKAGHLERVAA